MSIADEIKKLADLKRDGFLTDEEYEGQKKILLKHANATDDAVTLKEVEFFACSVNAWLSYRQEGNKQLLLLSSGALALLVGLASSDRMVSGFDAYFYLTLWCGIAFFACLSSSLLELKYSPAYLEALVKEQEVNCLECKLKLLEKISNWTFWLGAIGLFALVFYNFF